MQNEGRNSTAAAGTRSARGLHKDPYGVAVKARGRVSATGRCTPLSFLEVSQPVDGGFVAWTRIDIERLLFSQPAALLVVQGLPLMRFFEGVFFDSPNSPLQGSFVFLRGELSPIMHPPLTLSNIVLGRVNQFPEELTKEHLMSILLQNVLP